MSESASEKSNPIPKIRSLAKGIDCRRALTRITNAVLAGELDPKIANSAVYAIAEVRRLNETEMLEKRLDALEQTPTDNRPRLVYEAEYSEAS